MLLSRSRTPRRGESWSYEIDTALRVAARRIRWHLAWKAMSNTFAIPVAAAAAWIGLARFTLLEISYWPSLLFFAAWFVLFLITAARRRVTPAQSARYLDRVLALDERTATYVELQRQSRIARHQFASQRVLNSLAADVTQSLRDRMDRLPSLLSFRFRLRHIVLLATTIAFLLVALFLPTALDAVRAEKALLQQSIATQTQKIADLRAEIVQRPNLSPDVQASLVSELDKLDKQLHAKDIDQASMLAALADSQERIRQLSSAPASDFDGLVRAAQLVFAAAANTPNWDPAESHETTDLGKAAEALDFLAGYRSIFTIAQKGAVSLSLESASVQSGTRYSDITKDLADGARAIRTSDNQASARSLRAAADKFRRANGQQQTALAVEDALAKLEEGRQSVAQSANPASKKPQVGFRRRDAASAAAAASATAPLPGTPAQSSADPGNSANGSTQPNGTPTDPQNPSNGSTSPRIGSNIPAFGSSQQSNQPALPGNSDSKTGKSGSSASGDPNGGQSGSSAAGGGQSGDSSSKGSLQGPISGPIGGGAGAISQVQNPEGQGVSGSTQQTQITGSGSGAEQVYVPSENANPSAPSVPGQAAPQNSKGGESGSTAVGQTGGDDKSGKGTGAGAVINIRTPYTEVIGQYAEQAAQSMDHAYIPSDAKEYVKQYFTGLGK